MTIEALLHDPRDSHNPRGRAAVAVPGARLLYPFRLGITQGGTRGLGTFRSSHLPRRRPQPDPSVRAGAGHQHGHHRRRRPRFFGRRAARRDRRGREPGAHRESSLDRHRRARRVPAARTAARHVHRDVLAPGILHAQARWPRAADQLHGASGRRAQSQSARGNDHRHRRHAAGGRHERDTAAHGHARGARHGADGEERARHRRADSRRRRAAELPRTSAAARASARSASPSTAARPSTHGCCRTACATTR